MLNYWQILESDRAVPRKHNNLASLQMPLGITYILGMLQSVYGNVRTGSLNDLTCWAPDGGLSPHPDGQPFH